MVSPELYKNSHTYDFFIRTLGYQRSIDRFLRGLELDCEPSCRILDAGCGTGLLGLHFLERFSQGSLLATDLEPNFLHATMKNAARRDLVQNRIRVGVANISTPHQVKSLQGEQWELDEGSFDLICVGAVLGYADDTESSIRTLLRLLAPGGYLINLEMNEGIVGRFVSNRYRYDNIRIERIHEVVRDEGCRVTSKKLSISHLPARLTRTAIIARKELSEASVERDVARSMTDHLVEA